MGSRPLFAFEECGRKHGMRESVRDEGNEGNQGEKERERGEGERRQRESRGLVFVIGGAEWRSI